jgi:hypothetical protein
MRRVLIIALCAVALSGCGRKNEQPQQQPSSSAFEAAPAEKPQAQPQQQASGGLFSGSCPALPAKAQVEAGIKSAMVAIYGTDESTMRFVVSTVTPGSDCKTAMVAYKSAGSPSKAPLAYDNDKWSVTLFNKPYPIP